MNKPKILIWDIESSYNLVLAFDNYETNINLDNIVIERHLHCISYRWYGEKTIHTISQLDDLQRFKKNIHDDYHVLSTFSKIISKADAHVAHYGDKFDITMFNGRLLLNNLSPLPHIISYDTKKIANKYFRLNFNKLEYLAKALGYKGKTENPKDLWRKCFEGDIPSLKHLAHYNRNDVDILTFVFEKLMPFVRNHSLNANMFFEGAKCTNPICGSSDIEWRGYNINRTGRYRRFVCRKCGGWSNERKVINIKPLLK